MVYPRLDSQPRLRHDDDGGVPRARRLLVSAPRGRAVSRCDVPIIIVQTVYPGAAPDIVESELTRPLEKAINTISGLRHLSSTSHESLSVITAEFDLGIDATRAAEICAKKSPW
jgi:hypothetical protein